MPIGPPETWDTPPAIPIVLGVVGHRNLGPEPGTIPALESAVTRVFAEFDAAYPSSPKLLLSSLAPGADQLAARVALHREHWSVRAPLPFEPDVYEQSTSFDKDDGETTVPEEPARKALRELLAHPKVEWFVVPLPAELQREPAAWGQVARGQPGESEGVEAVRNACYANVGGYIVRNCHTLLALWDGEGPVRPSGTAEVVAMQLTGAPPRLYPWTAERPLGFDGERGPVIVVHVPRGRLPDDGKPTGSRFIRVPAPEGGNPYGEFLDVPRVAWRLGRLWQLGARIGQTLAAEPEHTALQEYQQFLSICQSIDDFNAAAHSMASAAAPTRQAYAESLKQVDIDSATYFPEDGPADPLKPGLRDWLRRLLRIQEIATCLANRLSPAHTAAGIALPTLLLLAVTMLGLYAHPVWGDPEDHPRWLLAGFLITWPVLVAVLIGLWWMRLEDRRMDYRALAEALRVRRAWALAGVGRSVADTYMNQLRSEVVWVRRALQHLSPPAEFWEQHFRLLSEDRQSARLHAVARSWVSEQQRHHGRRSVQERVRATRLRRAGFACALVGLGVLVLLLIPTLDDHPTRHPLLVGGTMLLALGGLLVAVCEWRTHEVLAKQYERMHVLFTSGARALETALNASPPDIPRAKAIIGELGREAVEENAQWLLLRRSKPLELPLGG